MKSLALLFLSIFLMAGFAKAAIDLDVVRVGDINKDTDYSNPYGMTEMNGFIYFAANDGFTGYELWRTEISTGKTNMIKDIYDRQPTYYGQTYSSDPDDFVVFNGKLYFAAEDDTNGRELWVTDGTSQGTKMVTDINSGSSGSSPYDLTVANGWLFFIVDYGTTQNVLMRSDGTAANTVDLQPEGTTIDGVEYLTVVGNRLYFSAQDYYNGGELWVTDGTSQGTKLVKDINPSGNSDPSELINVNGVLHFVADDGTNGRELWKTVDGTPEKTFLVMDIMDGSTGSNPHDLVNLNGVLFFFADNGVHGDELWRSSPTTTVMVKDINEGSSGSSGDYLVAGRGVVYFVASTPTKGTELWKSDGTAAGTVMVKDIWSGTQSSNPEYLTFDNSKGILYFVANSESAGRELWKSDGTTAGTTMIKDLKPFSSKDYNENFDAFVSWEDFHFYLSSNGILFFTADGIDNNQIPVGIELFRSDGTAAGTKLVFDINKKTQDMFDYSEFVDFNGYVYFAAGNEATGMELWKSDGTPQGTMMVKDITGDADNSWPYGFRVFDNKLYFVAWTKEAGEELWVTDGTSKGTKMIKDINSGSGDSDPVILQEMDGFLYFLAEEGYGYDLWRTNGKSVGTTKVRDLGYDYYDAGYDSTVFEGDLYFSIYDDWYGDWELWKSDGTDSGTDYIGDIDREAESFFISYDLLHFISDDYIFYINYYGYLDTIDGNYEEVNEMVIFNDVVYFAAEYDDWYDWYEMLYYIDEYADAYTISAYDEDGYEIDDYDPFDLVVFNGELIFSCYLDNYDDQLCYYDSYDDAVYPWNSNEEIFGVSGLTVYGDVLLFEGYSLYTYDYELYGLDLNGEISLVKDIETYVDSNGIEDSSYPYAFFSSTLDYVFFVAETREHGEELYIAANQCPSMTYYKDYDGDGYGRESGKVESCTDLNESLASGSSFTWVVLGNDCNDANSKINPAAPEICKDGIDNNCNGFQNEPCITKAQARAMGY